jgi:DNA mismatch repair protein MutS2
METDNHTLKILGFYRILNFLEYYAYSDLGKKGCKRLFPESEITEIKYKLNLVSELKRLLLKNGKIPIEGSCDIEPFIKKAGIKDSIIYNEEFIKIRGVLLAFKNLKKYLNSLEEGYPHLKAFVKDLIPTASLEKAISITFNEYGAILDSASTKLKEIRNNLKRIRNGVKKKLEKLLYIEGLAKVFQERIITSRNGRYVLPVRANLSYMIKGVIHDYSQSKFTNFIEPLETVEDNNKINILLKEEEEEILRILISLTNEVSENSSIILHNLDILREIEITLAKVYLSQAFKGCAPSFEQNNHISLISAFHPILLASSEKEQDNPELFCRLDFNSKVVPVDIFMNSDTKALIISGANTGGKTVTLKTLGLLTLMAQTGMHIPVKEGSKLKVFKKIFADIGDEQDIEASLSTFSGHLSQIKKIIEKTDDETLVLLDEIGTGTDPQEGASLAMSIMDYLLMKDAYFAVTTHSNIIKAYAFTKTKVKNVSVEFDSKTLKPTYHLIYGYPGESNALTIARHLNLQDDIIDGAEKYLKEENRQILIMMKEFEKQTKEIKKELNTIKALKEKALDYEEKTKRLHKVIKNKKEEILEGFEKELKGFLSGHEIEIQNLLKNLRKVNLKEAEEKLTIFKKKKKDMLSLFKKDEPKKAKNNKDIKKGDLVRIISLNQKGTVEKILKDSGKIILSIHGLKISGDINDMEKLETKPSLESYSYVKEKISLSNFSTSLLPEIKIIGMTVSEAIPIVDKFIDQAILRGWERIEIVHGTGTGKLKKALREEFLKTHPQVKHFSQGGVPEGGDRVTIVYLK